MTKEETIKELKKLFGEISYVRRCKDIDKLKQGLRLSDGANNPFIEDWFYEIHDRLDYLDPTGEEV